ncbi:MAG: exosortase A [Porphyrobacter sp.]|nr:exosortase A [Porphyrobacter sp.]
MPREATLPGVSAAAVLPRAWRGPLQQLAIAWVGLIALTWADWAEMAHQWWDVSTYNHILLVPAILAWLVWTRWPDLANLTPKAWWPGLALMGAGLLAWSGGSAAEINLVSQFGAVLLLQAAAVTLLGVRVAAGLAFPLGYMLFLVPFGDEIVPALQAITAKLAIGLTHASGVPATIDGVFIDTPAGLFEVAEACSGVKFLVAMFALGTLVAHLCFSGTKRRLVWMTAAIVVPVLANGVRAWGTIYVAQSQGVEFAAGFDHIVYGWVFFAIVMGGLLASSWKFFDRSPEDQLIDVEAIENSPLLMALATLEIGGWRAVLFILFATAATAAAMDRVGLLT